MAAEGVSSVISVKNSLPIAQSLTFAVLEWLLLFLLFISALISYSVSKFAHYCGLETPCLLCSRLDHVLGNEKLGFHWDLICRNHKLEISSMVLCHAHSNLVDVHGLCETCLFSFATINKSNAETYRLLVGKLGVHEVESCSDGCDSITELCRCCSEPRGRAKIIQTELADIDVPLGAIDHYVEETLIKTSMEDEDFHQKNREIGTLLHVGYRELKINSDTESDALFSDDDETGALISNMVVSVDLGAMEPLVSVSLDETTLSQIGEVEASANNSSSSSVHEMDADAIEDHKDVYEVHVLEEINWQWKNPSPVPEFISFDDFPSSTNDDPSLTLVKLTTSENYVAEANESDPSESDGTLEVETNPITETENSLEENLISSSGFSPKILNLLDLGDAAYELTVGHRRRQLSGVLEEQWSETESPRVGEDSFGYKVHASIELATKDSPVSVPANETNSSQIMEEEEKEASVGISSPDLVLVSQDDKTPSGHIVEEEASEIEIDAGEARKDVYEVPAASGNDPVEETNQQTSKSKSSQLIISSGDFPSSTKDDDLIIPTLVELPSESYAEETNGSVSDKPIEANMVSTGSSPKVRDEEVNKASLERNESNISYDGSIVSEIEGESVVERLKRQMELDRRAMRVLYKELEEERNASSVSTNQAMAMITRLQEEKAALHMEALQYLRVMEEQEEYDTEALQRSNELLAEKEKEFQELEDELEFYKNNNNRSSSSILENVGPDIYLGNINDTLLCIEDERLQLQQCLDDLEKKLHVSSIYDVVNNESVGGECSNKEEEGVDLVKEVRYLKDKLEGIERDRSFLDRAIKYLRIGDEGLLFIQDIASNLQEMRSNRLKMDVS